MPSTGRMYLSAVSINPNDETFLHELLHTATQYNGVYDITTNVNDVLRILRKELEYDEGLAGQIYRASQAGKTLTLNNKNSANDVINAIEGSVGNFRNAHGVFRDNVSNPSEGKTVPDYLKAKARRREDRVPGGEHEQRERSRRFISQINSIFKDTEITADKLPAIVDMVRSCNSTYYLGYINRTITLV